MNFNIFKAVVTVAVIALLVVGFKSWANEKFQMNITSLSDGGQALNLTALADGGTSGYGPAARSLLTLQALNQPACVCVGQISQTTQRPDCSTSNCLQIPTGAALPTSCPPNTVAKLPAAILSDGGTLLPDGGTVDVFTNLCIISLVRTADGGTTTLRVNTRIGDEF